MVFITLWLQLLGFSDFAASLLMALFALGSALGGLLGGAIGETPFRGQPPPLTCMDSTQSAAHLHVGCGLRTQDTMDHHECLHPLFPSQRLCRLRLIMRL